MAIISNEWFQTVGIPLILTFVAQGLYLLGKHSAKITISDFSSLPYSLGASSLAINAALALPRVGEQNSISLFMSLSVLIILALIVIAVSQRFISRRYPLIVNILASALSLFIMAATFQLWR